LIEPGDRVLCIDNGFFGNGFGEFAKMYGAEVVYLKSDYRNAIDPKALEAFLSNDNRFKLATLVHCETPSGITNPVDEICPILKKHNILSVVDAVSAVGGEPIEVDAWAMDVVIVGSQKCLSAAPGLTLMSISPVASSIMSQRKTPIPGFYNNLTIWNNWYENREFPYTQPISQIYQLSVALERALNDSARLERHSQLATVTRTAFERAGFELYALSGHASTVTTVMLPEGITFKTLFDAMRNDHNILIGGGLGHLDGKVFRIGHMGENCHEEWIWKTFNALNEVFLKLGVALKAPLWPI
jgi:aspartate aminotransferase-like enzyme